MVSWGLPGHGLLHVADEHRLLGQTVLYSSTLCVQIQGHC